MHFHDNLTDTQHYITLDHDVNLGSTTPQILRGVRLAIRPNYFPPEVTSPTWTTRTTVQTSDTVHSSPTRSEREDVATIFQANPLYLSSNVGHEPERHREVGEYYRVKVLKLFITKTGSVKRQLQVIHGKRKDVFKPRQQELPRRRFPKGTPVFRELNATSQSSSTKVHEFIFTSFNRIGTIT